MMKQIKFFRLNDHSLLPDVKLGDSIDELLKSNIIKRFQNNDIVELRYSQNEDIWVGDESGIVKYIYFTNETGCDFLKFDPYSFPYPATKPITTYISDKFEHLENIKNMEELKKSKSGNYLILIFRDFIPRNIVLYKNFN